MEYSIACEITTKFVSELTKLVEGACAHLIGLGWIRDKIAAQLVKVQDQSGSERASGSAS